MVWPMDMTISYLLESWMIFSSLLKKLEIYTEKTSECMWFVWKKKNLIPNFELNIVKPEHEIK